MKKIISLLLAIMLILGVSCVASAQSDIQVILDGRIIEFDQPPVIISDRTMVPMRAIYEALGAEVNWDAESRTASGTKTGITVSFTIDEALVDINYNEKEIDAPATIVSDRTLVPVRALAEGFGLKVEWDAANRIVFLYEQNSPVEILVDGKINKVPTQYTYHGQINANNKPHGFGTAYFPDGRIFCGSFHDRYSMDGFLFYTNPLNGIKSAQQYDDGKSTGYVEMEWPNGNIYKGSYKNGQFTGYGEFYGADGTTYRGEWLNGSYEGTGELIWPDGSWYKGDWKAGVRSGKGTYYDATSKQTITGDWEDDQYVV